MRASLPIHVAGLIFAAVLSASLAASATAGPPDDFDFETILVDDMWNNRSSTAVDADGVVHVVYAAQFHTDSSTAEVWYARKAAAPGSSWTFTQVTNNTVREEFPCLALDALGNVHIAFHTGVVGGTNKIRYVNNIGQAPGSFNPIVDITGNGYSITRVAIDSEGVAHLAFRTHTGVGAQEMMYRTYDPDTDTLGPLVNLSNTPGQDDFGADIAIDADDGVHVVWQRGTAISGPLAYLYKPAGGSFSEIPTGVPGSIFDAKLVIDANGKISIFYRPNNDALRYVELLPGETEFTPSQPVYTGTYRSAFIERIASDINGMRYIVFASNIAANRGIFYVEETEENVWAEPLRLAGEDGGNQSTSIAINADGELAVTWSISRVVGGIVMADLFGAFKTVDLGGPGPCLGDLNDSGAVDVQDLLILLGAWGPCPGKGACPADLNDSGAVDVQDLLILLGAWGPCP